MRSAVLTIHHGLAARSRVGAWAQGTRSSDIAALGILLAAGAAAAGATVCLDFGLRVPGHAILRGVFPMALGLALAPRRMGGTVMGASAVCGALALTMSGSFTVGVGAVTSLVLIGPFLDVALWRVGTGSRLYLAFALTGLACNLAALAVRSGVKFVGFDHATARPFATWWLQAIGSYALCGIVAGLFSATAWFRFAADRSSARSRLPS